MKRINSADKRRVRVDVCNRYSGLCCYCQAYVGMRGTIDHYLPEALGGTNERANLRWACEPCNGAKADMHPAEWERVRPQPELRKNRLQTKIELLQLIAYRARATKGPTTTQQS